MTLGSAFAEMLKHLATRGKEVGPNQPVFVAIE